MNITDFCLMFLGPLKLPLNVWKQTSKPLSAWKRTSNPLNVWKQVSKLCLFLFILHYARILFQNSHSILNQNQFLLFHWPWTFWKVKFKETKEKITEKLMDLFLEIMHTFCECEMIYFKAWIGRDGAAYIRIYTFV